MAFNAKIKEELKTLQERSGVPESGENAGEESTAAQEAPAVIEERQIEEEPHDISEVFDDMWSMRGPAWPVIAALLVALYPLGIFLIIIKVNRELEEMKKNSRISAGIGILLILLGILYAALGYFGVIRFTKKSDLIGSAIFLLVITCVGGVILIRKGIRSGHLADMNEKYRPVILDTPDGSVDAIAQKCGETYEVCYQNLKQLILAGFIPSARLKKSTRSLVVRKNRY